MKGHFSHRHPWLPISMVNARKLLKKRRFPNRTRVGVLDHVLIMSLRVGVHDHVRVGVHDHLFENFIKPVCSGRLDHAGKTFDLEREFFKFIVLVPGEFGPTFHANLPTALPAPAFEEILVKTGSRGFPVHVRTEMSNGTLELCDIPTTLSVLPRAIRLYLGKQCIGTDNDERLLQTRELANFRRALEQLIDEPDHWRLRGIVECRDWYPSDEPVRRGA